ncbi:unnamed protein product [Polarella glacialis]|uniref:ATP-dependent transporter ycf16 n=2 Tax=Polarella glacialis TaxID=89957 RepID=A0A813EHV7_POLGL|nr:unnamed protein product [Polarella glacialis]
MWGNPVHRRRSAMFSFLLVLALAAANAAAVAQSFAQRDYMTALAQRDAATFAAKLGYAMLLLACTMPARCLAEFATGGLVIVWRDSITESLLDDYFQPRAVYWLRRESSATDPDMRIAVEAGHFSDSLVLMVRDVFENSLKLCGFLGVVFSISRPLCAVMAAYAILGALATVQLFGRPLVSLDRGIRAQEAAFRSILARCRERAEALCLSAGESSEGAEARLRYQRLRRQQWARACWRTGLGTFRECFNWAAYLVPISLVAPLWLQGDVPFGTVSQAVMAFQVSLGALSVVVRKFRSVSSLVAEGGRLESLVEALHRATAAAQSPMPEVELLLPQDSAAALELQDLSLWLPGGQAGGAGELCHSLCLELRAGERLAVFGPSGTGKTTLVRSMAGLWAHGSGRLRRAADTVFLSQEPYVPEGTLRRLLTFPAPAGQFSDEELCEAARRACLGRLLERYGRDLEAQADWEAVLSRGEQQRCAVCRLLLLRPRLAVLDEATSALDEATEEALYAELLALQPSSSADSSDARTSIVSVSHRPSVQRFHTHLLCRKNLESPSASDTSASSASAEPEKKAEWLFKPAELL